MLGKALQGAALATQPVFVEEVFQTHLYTGNGSTQTITNGIDLAGEGGLVWIKSRSGTFGAYDHMFFDTARGAGYSLQSNNTEPNSYFIDTLSSFNSNGFSLGADGSFLAVNKSSTNYTSWTFRKQAKFFDVVTYTGTGSAQTISHNLGSVPGCIIVKRTDTTANWAVYHRSLTSSRYSLLLNLTGAEDLTDYFSTTAPTSSQFTVGTNSVVNASGGTYVAYLFAHDAGGFGESGADNVISCGSFTSASLAYPNINLGYEPQWVLIKRADNTSNWWIMDNMRPDFTANAASGNIDTKVLRPNLSNAEGGNSVYEGPNATGFSGVLNFSGTTGTYIYIAIRRGPMKTPTSGTSVFSPVAFTGNSASRTITSGFPVDLVFSKGRNSTLQTADQDRLRGAKKQLLTSETDAESSPTTGLTGFDVMTGITVDGSSGYWNTTYNYIQWFFRRAPGFFDVVCYTGTGSATTFAHNLGVVPELMIMKKRSATDDWAVYAGDNTDFLLLNTTAATADDNTYWNDTTPTSTVFSVGTNADVNTSAATYVAYLFASLAGVSKVGSYTGTGTTLQVNCGFTAGARFVLIKRTDSTGDWYVWDSARGIVAGNDPYLLLNSTAAEVTSTDYVDAYSAGFEISSTAPAAINANGGTFIFLAVA